MLDSCTAGTWFCSVVAPICADSVTAGTMKRSGQLASKATTSDFDHQLNIYQSAYGAVINESLKLGAPVNVCVEVTVPEPA